MSLSMRSDDLRTLNAVKVSCCLFIVYCYSHDLFMCVFGPCLLILCDNGTPSFTKDYLACTIMLFIMKFERKHEYSCQKSIKRAL